MNKSLLKNIIIITCTIALTIVAMGVIFYCLAVYDAPAPDDSAYKTAYNPVPPETNAIVTLEKLAGKVKTGLKDYPELDGCLSEAEWEDFMQGNRIDFELQVLVVTRNQEALALFSEAMKKPNVQFVPPVGEFERMQMRMRNDKMQTFNPADFLNLNTIVRATWQNTKDGKIIFAWDDALKNIQFLKKFGTAQNITFINFLIAQSCEKSASDLLIKNIGNLDDKAVAIQVAAVLNEDTLSLADMKFWPAGEYAIMDASLRTADMTPREALISRYMLKPNDTRRRALELFGRISKAIEQGSPTLDMPPKKNWDESFSLGRMINLLKPNAGGCVLVDMLPANYNGIYKSTLADFARLRVQACAFALRAYWLDHGRLPDSLDELAPQYIKTVPPDIYGGKPMQYDHARAVVYSAGPKQIYDAGEFAREPNAHPGGERPFVLLDW